MRNIPFALAALALTTTATSAFATPSTLGFYPSTDIYGKGNFHLDVDDYASTDLDNDVPSVGLTYGIGDSNKALGRSEVGFDYFLREGSFGDKIWLNAKTQLLNNETSGTRLVAGAWGVGSNDAGAPNYLYLLGSKSFNFGRVHLGVAHAFEEDAIGQDPTSVQLGYDRMLSKKLQFAVDFYSGKGSLSGVQPSLYYAVNSNASFGLGYFRPNNDDIDSQIYLCFDYNFGAPAPEANPANPGADTPAPAPQ